MLNATGNDILWIRSAQNIFVFNNIERRWRLKPKDSHARTCDGRWRRDEEKWKIIIIRRCAPSKWKREISVVHRINKWFGARTDDERWCTSFDATRQHTRRHTEHRSKTPSRARAFISIKRINWISARPSAAALLHCIQTILTMRWNRPAESSMDHVPLDGLRHRSECVRHAALVATSQRNSRQER